MKSDRLRLRASWAALTSDPYRKLSAIVLAVGLWFFINGQIRNAVPRTVSLTWVGSVRTAADNFGDRLAVVLPSDRVIGRRFMNGDTEIQTAIATLRGPRFKIDGLSNIQLDLQIAGFTGLDWTSRRDIEFTAADIRPDILLQGVEIELEPPRIRLEVERLEEYSLRLSLDVVEVDVGDDELAKRLRLDTAEFQPPTARILGPASAIRKFREPGPKFLQTHVLRVGLDRQVSAAVELSVGKEQGLRLAEVPTVTFQVLPITQVFTFELPLVIDDLALEPALRGQYRADQPSRRVRIKVGGQLLFLLANLPSDAQRQEWAASNLRLLVVVPRLEGGGEYRSEIVQEARLLLLETSQLMTVDRTERLLDEAVSVTLRRQP
jgi:hypothetical protein